VSGKKSQDKGKRGEREVCAAFKAHDHEAVRGLTQADGGRGCDVIVHTYEGNGSIGASVALGVEVKRTAKPPSKKVQEWREQAEYHCAGTGMLPALCDRHDGGQWWISMPLDVFLEVMG